MPPPRPPTEPKVAIVTGASRGLGRGVAAILAKEAGFTVYAAGRTTADLEKLQAECADGPGKVVPCTLDLKDDEAVKAFVEKVKAEAGNRRAREQRLPGPRRPKSPTSAKSSTSNRFPRTTTTCLACAGPMPFHN